MSAFIAGYLISTVRQVLPKETEDTVKLMTAVVRTVESVIVDNGGSKLYVEDFMDRHLTNVGVLNIVDIMQRTINIAKRLEPSRDDEKFV